MVGIWTLLTVAQTASAQKFVRRLYDDAACTQFTGGPSSQQSWQAVRGVSHCYDLTLGMGCDFTCTAKLVYATGSGIEVQEMPDSTCIGAYTIKRPLAPLSTWPVMYQFFNGECVSDGRNKFMKMSTPLPANGYPNCSRYSALDSQYAGDPFDSSYNFQLYTDRGCTQAYQVRSDSTVMASRYTWKRHRGPKFCYDVVDATVMNPNVTFQRGNQDIMNINLICSNPSTYDNGITVEYFTGTACSGTVSRTDGWMRAFQPMNFEHIRDMYSGQCVKWGLLWGKFDTAWDPAQHPDCREYACTKGACIGGTPSTGVTGNWGPFQGNIGVAKVGNSRAARVHGTQVVSFIVLLRQLWRQVLWPS